MSARARFIKTVVSVKDLPDPDKPEIALLGRSNAGKSSLINAMFQTRVAKTSQTPGKTRALNFFDVADKYRLVDMPGYGFAKVSGKEIRSWQKLIEDYLVDREALAGMALIMDIRRKWSDDEQMLADFAERLGKPMIVVLNKMDKAKQSEKVLRVREVSAQPGVTAVHMTSCLNRVGTKELEDLLYSTMVSPFVRRPS